MEPAQDVHESTPRAGDRGPLGVWRRARKVVDDPSVFTFSVGEGMLCGPSMGVREKTRAGEGNQVRSYPVGTALPGAEGHMDTALYMPQKVIVTFAPRSRVVYKSAFVVAVAGGDPAFFTCVGCGSYDDEIEAGAEEG